MTLGMLLSCFRARTSVPREPGSDWRDLPNAVVKLADGTYADRLVYNYDDWKTGRSKKGVKRGVCACKNGKQGLSCDPGDKQGRLFNSITIIWPIF